jgi:L-ascorbate metabolism protein UlaG (beta-lactamase superfamily)
MIFKSVIARMFCIVAILALLPLLLPGCSVGSANTGGSADTGGPPETGSLAGTGSSADISSPAGTGSSPDTSSLANTGGANDADSMTIRFIGNSCFYIEFSDGTRLVSDPYPSSYDYIFAPFPEIEADIIFATHSHADHNAYSRIAGSKLTLTPDDVSDNQSFSLGEGKVYVVYPTVVDKTIKIGQVEIRGYSSNHIKNLGKNTVFIVNYKGLKAVHMGETDKIESQEALDAVKDADVLFAYMGNLGKVKNDDILAFAEEMNIKVIIPQHYSIARSFYDASFIEEIIEGLPENLEVVNADKITVEKGMKKQFVVLSPMGTES